jgi:hypothetical protein
LSRHTVAVVLAARAMLALATAMLASADSAMPEEDAEVTVGDAKDASVVEAQTLADVDKIYEDEVEEGVIFAGFTTLSMNTRAAYASIEDLSRVPGGIPMGIGTPTEGTIAGINLGTTGIIVGNPANAPPGSITVTNATVTSINNGTAKVTSVTAPDSITVTPAGAVSFNPEV